MKILMWILVIFGGGVGLFSTLYIMVSLIGVIAYKFYRKLRFGISIFN